MSRASLLEEGLNSSAARGRRTARKREFAGELGVAAAELTVLTEPAVETSETGLTGGGSLTAVAEAVNVLEESSPTGEQVVSTSAAADPVTAGEVNVAAQTPENALLLAQRLTYRQRHGDKKPTRVTIACPENIITRIEAVTRKMGNDERIGKGLTPLNKGALMTEAARRFATNPNQYPAIQDDQFTANPPLHGGVAEDIWTEMKTRWWDLPERSPNFGQHIAAAINEIVTELESLYD